MFGQRLKEERTRLGLTQPILADCVGSAKRTIVDWEQEKSSPTARQLMAMQGLGIDTNYLLTGQRIFFALTTMEEQLLLKHFRSLSTDKQETVLQFLLGGINSLNNTKNEGYINQGTHKGDVNFGK